MCCALCTLSSLGMLPQLQWKQQLMNRRTSKTCSEPRMWSDPGLSSTLLQPCAKLQQAGTPIAVAGAERLSVRYAQTRGARLGLVPDPCCSHAQSYDCRDLCSVRAERTRLCESSFDLPRAMLLQCLLQWDYDLACKTECMKFQSSGRTSKFLCTYLGCALKEHQRALLHTETAIHIADSIEVDVVTDE